MPQFDKITFFTQIFWLLLIFFSFYFLTLQGVLPKLAAVLKSRKKKLSLGSSKISTLKVETLLVAYNHNNLLEILLEEARIDVGSKTLKFRDFSTLCKNKDLLWDTKSVAVGSYL